MYTTDADHPCTCIYSPRDSLEEKPNFLKISKKASSPPLAFTQALKSLAILGQGKPTTGKTPSNPQGKTPSNNREDTLKPTTRKTLSSQQRGRHPPTTGKTPSRQQQGTQKAPKSANEERTRANLLRMRINFRLWLIEIH